jgi:hypothetical protein
MKSVVFHICCFTRFFFIPPFYNICFFNLLFFEIWCFFENCCFLRSIVFWNLMRLCKTCMGGMKQNQNLLLFEICCFLIKNLRSVVFWNWLFFKFVYFLNLLLWNTFFSKMCCFWNLLFYKIYCFSYMLFFKICCCLGPLSTKQEGLTYSFGTYQNVEAYGWSENEIGTKLFEIVPKLHSPHATKRLPTRVVTLSLSKKSFIMWQPLWAASW